MAKAKATPDETIKRDKPAVKPTPPASSIEKTESFTAAFKGDAHAAADYFVKDKQECKEEVSREESSAGDGGVTVTITYK